MQHAAPRLRTNDSDAALDTNDSSSATIQCATAANSCSTETSDPPPRLLWRMEKLAMGESECEQHLPQPEDEDDSRDRDDHAEVSAQSSMSLLPPLTLKISGASASNPSPPSLSLLPKTVQSAPTRSNYHSIASASVEGNSTRTTVVREEIQNARTRLLPAITSTASPTIASREFWRAVHASSSSSATTTSTNHGRRHSILRFGSLQRPWSAHGRMKKSASVEFQLQEEDRRKHATSEVSVRSHTPGVSPPGRETPRRLTEEEKEELYRIRPDLEIGPSPFFQEQLAEQDRRNQLRILVAMFGGIVSIVLLVVFYALLARG